MSGPFALRYLHLFIKDKSPGAFILSRNGRAADLVGSSEDDLADAIQRATADRDYRYVWFECTASAEQAQDLEQAWHHRYRPTDNRSAPPTRGKLAWRCTTEGCAACALSPVR